MGQSPSHRISVNHKIPSNWRRCGMRLHSCSKMGFLSVETHGRPECRGFYAMQADRPLVCPWLTVSRLLGGEGDEALGMLC